MATDRPKRERTTGRDDPLGLAMRDYQRGDPGRLVYRDGHTVRDGRVEEFYFTPPDQWSDETIADLERLAAGGGPIVDVGCGTGWHVRWFHDRGVEAVGVDVSPNAVATARELHAGNVPVIVGDMRDLPFGAGQFGALHCAGTQLGLGGSLAGIAELLGEFARVTTDDAVALVDNYDPRPLDADFVGYRSDPRDGIARRCFHFEYEPSTPTPAAGECDRDAARVVGRSLRFLLCTPARLREAAIGTPWTVTEVRDTNPGGTHYRALLERRA